jgi:type I restriction enzyme, R subunit
MMDQIGQAERKTQNRIIKLFNEKLGYQYLENWEDKINNSNIEEGLLKYFFTEGNDYPEVLISRALDKLRSYCQ